MDCTVITPIGPGHNEISQQALQSVMLASEEGMGPFSAVHIVVGDDTHGVLGRSHARNAMVKGGVEVQENGSMKEGPEPWMMVFSTGEDQAAPFKSEWIFFLDADDVLCSQKLYGASPFITVGKYVNDYDAIWGTIFELHPSGQIFQRKQPASITNYKHLVKTTPYTSIQMGHFVRRSCFEGFNEDLNVGEDFDYYLRMWKEHRCIKQSEPLFLNRRGAHSWNEKVQTAPSGRPLPTGRDWNLAVNEMMTKAREDLDD